MKKMIAVSIGAVLLIISVPFAGFAATSAALIKGDLNYYSIRSEAQNAGYSVEWRADERAIALKKGEQKLDVFLGFKWFKRNGEYVALNEPLMIENGIAYISRASAYQIFGTLEVPAGKTVDQLIASSVIFDKDLRILRNTLDKNTEVLTEAERGISALLPNMGNGVTDLQANSAWVSVLGSRVQEDITKKSIINRQDILSLQIEGLYDGLIAALETETLYTSVLENARINAVEAELKFKNGMISSIDLQKAQNAVSSAQGNLLIQQASIKEAKNNLSKLTGIAADEIIPVGSAELKPLGNFNLESAYLSAEASSYSIYALNKSTLLAKYGVDYYVFNVGSAPYRAKELDLSNAQIEVEKEKDRLHKILLNTWQEIVRAEEKDRMYSVQLAEKQKDLETLRLQRSLGLVTDQQFRMAWLGVEELNLTKLGNVITHRQLMRTLEKPWLSN